MWRVFVFWTQECIDCKLCEKCCEKEEECPKATKDNRGPGAELAEEEGFGGFPAKGGVVSAGGEKKKKKKKKGALMIVWGLCTCVESKGVLEGCSVVSGLTSLAFDVAICRSVDSWVQEQLP